MKNKNLEASQGFCDPDGPGIPAYSVIRKRKRKSSTCFYNEGVICADFKCGSCGFNPDGKRRKT